VFNKRQALLTLCVNMGSPLVFGGVRVAHPFGLCCDFLFYLPPLDCPFFIVPLVFSNVYLGDLP
jgi:hypothetical protein